MISFVFLLQCENAILPISTCIVLPLEQLTLANLYVNLQFENVDSFNTL